MSAAPDLAPARRTVPSAVRWLAVPTVVAVLVLSGLAVSAQDRDEFRHDRSEASADDGSDPIDGSSDDDGSNLEIRSDDGRFGVRFDGDSVVIQPRTGADADGEAIRIGSGGDGSTGFRLSGTGRSEEIDRGQVEPGDAVVRGVDGGLDLLASDGGHLEIRPDRGQDSGLRLTEVAPDGTRSELEPGTDGVVDLGAGVSLRVPTAPGPVNPEVDADRPPVSSDADQGSQRPLDDPQPGQAPAPAEGGGSGPGAGQPTFWERAADTPWQWIVLGIAVLAALSAAAAVYLQRRSGDEPFGPDFVGPGGVPVDRFDEFVAMLAADPDPARAIRLAFHAAERGMGDIPARMSTETPFEWHDRVVDGRRHLAHPLGSLCNRFATARFAPGRPSPADRDAAIAELVELERAARGRPDPDRGQPSQPGPTTVGHR